MEDKPTPFSTPYVDARNFDTWYKRLCHYINNSKFPDERLDDLITCLATEFARDDYHRNFWQAIVDLLESHGLPIQKDEQPSCTDESKPVAIDKIAIYHRCFKAVKDAYEQVARADHFRDDMPLHVDGVDYYIKVTEQANEITNFALVRYNSDEPGADYTEIVALTVKNVYQPLGAADFLHYDRTLRPSMLAKLMDTIKNYEQQTKLLKYYLDQAEFNNQKILAEAEKFFN